MRSEALRCHLISGSLSRRLRSRILKSLFAYFDRARNVAHFDLNWPTLNLEKKFIRASPKPKLQNYESEDHRLQ